MIYDICLCLTSLSMIISRSISITAKCHYLFHSFLWTCSISLCVCTHIYTFSLISGHLGCFHVLAIVTSAAVNVEVHVSF